MAYYFLLDNLFSWGFIASYLLMTLVVWLIMHFFFNIDDVRNALILTLLAMVFIPFIVSATEGYLALLVVVALGSLLVQYVFQWYAISWTEAILLFVVALAVTGWMLPAL